MICADRDIIPADMPMLKAKYNAIASDWESGSIAWVAKRNHIPCMILRTVSDAVDVSGDNFYHHYEDFKIAAERIMATLLKSLPGWLNASSKILT
jgi:nucleoside phosphorylase